MPHIHCWYDVMRSLGLLTLWTFVFIHVCMGVSPALQETTPVLAKCLRNVSVCEPLERTECLGVKLPYTHTSTVLANDSSTQEEVYEKLVRWGGLRHVPRCWEVIQPMLCAIYMPKCNNETNAIELPGEEICRETRGPCKIVEEMDGWPWFMHCKEAHFVSGCMSSIENLDFNLTGTCSPPLIPTDNQESWFEHAEGCGVQCENPLFTKSEHREMHLFIAVLGSLCLLCTLFTILTFLIDWKRASRYPALILFFMNCCFFVGSTGWMGQFVPGGSREEIVCKQDGTMRRGEPQLGSGESITCTVIFILVYYCMIAGITWFVILAYAWNLTFRAFRSARETLEPHKAIFHIAAWCIPLVLTIVCLARSEVDGDSLTGICFVGSYNHVYRGLFVLLPVGLVLVIGMTFLLAGLVTLCKLQASSPGILSDRASAKIRETIVRLGVFAFFALIFITITFVVHVYIFVNEGDWKTSFDQFILCEANVEGEKLLKNSSSVCDITNRPKLVAMEIHVFAYFGAGIVMSSWVWNRSTIDAWRRFFRRLCRLQMVEPVKIQKHKVIAQAFQKRREINAGRLSLSFASTHDDPLGMRFDAHSISSQEMTSVWASALPRMVMRRGALVYPAMMRRRHSDSDIESIKSVSSLQQKLMQLQKEAAGQQLSRRQSESHSQNSQSESDRSRRKKRHHRKRGRNRVIPLSSPGSSVPGTATTNQDPENRRSSLNSNGTNPSLTNVSQTQSSVTTGNRVNTSDEDHGGSPEGRRERRGQHEAHGLPSGKKKTHNAVVHAAKQEPAIMIHSSDEEQVTPELKRPPLPLVKKKGKTEAQEVIPSSDEDRATPEHIRPHRIEVATAAVVVERGRSEGGSESFHSSDEDRATPENSRPQIPGISREEFTAIQTQTTYTLVTNNKLTSTSLLDKVMELQDFDSDDDFDIDTCDLEVAEINVADSHRKRQDQAETEGKRTEKRRTDLCEDRKGKVIRDKEKDKVVCGNEKGKVVPVETKTRRHHRRPEARKLGVLPQAWSPESSQDQGRSRSPVMSAFKKVKDWMNAPTQTPVQPMTPIETPIFDLDLSKVIPHYNDSNGGERSQGRVKDRGRLVKPRRHRHQMHANRGYEESEA